MNESEAYLEIDLKKMIKALWKKAWLIILAAVILGGVTLGYGKYSYVPQYKAQTVLYASFADGNSNASSITQKDLADMSIAVLTTRSTLEEVIQSAGLDMTYQQLNGMVSASRKGSTELFTVTVKGTDAQETALIANTIAEVLPQKASAVNADCIVRTIDSALVPESAVTASGAVKNAAIAAVLGAALVCAAVIAKELIAAWKASPDA